MFIEFSRISRIFIKVVLSKIDNISFLEDILFLANFLGKGIIRPVGIQVSVWGDTKEIAQINLLYGHLSLLGDPDTSSPELQPESLANPTPPPTDNTEINQSTTSTEPSPEATQFWNPSQPESGNPSMNLFLLGGAAAVAAAVAVARVVRNQKVQIKSKPH